MASLCSLTDTTVYSQHGFICWTAFGEDELSNAVLGWFFYFFGTWVMAEWYAKPIKKSNCSYLTPGGEHHESTTGECYKASVTLRGFYCMSRISKTKNPAQGLISLNNALIFLIHLLLIAHKESGWLYFLIYNWTLCFPPGGRRFPRCAGEAVRWLC